MLTTVAMAVAVATALRALRVLVPQAAEVLLAVAIAAAAVRLQIQKRLRILRTFQQISVSDRQNLHTSEIRVSHVLINNHPEQKSENVDYN